MTTEAKIPCPCPQIGGVVQHPDGDEVTLRERLDFRSAVSIRNDFILARSEEYVTFGEALAALTEGYLYHGISGWTLTDAKGRPLPVSRAAIHDVILSDPEVATIIGDAADELYGVVIRPLLARAAASSNSMPTNGSTSAPKASSKKNPRRSSRSSTTTTPTGATVTTLRPRAGVSS